MKQDIYTIMSSVVCRDLYPKQMIEVNFSMVKSINSVNILSQCVNTLYYGLMCHGINLKDSFTSCQAVHQLHI